MGFAEGVDVLFKTKRIKVNGCTLDQVLRNKHADASDDEEEEETGEGQRTEDYAKIRKIINVRELRLSMLLRAVFVSYSQNHQRSRTKAVDAVASSLCF